MAIREEDHVLVGTTDNFDELVTDDNNVLVHFYAPWAGHSKALAPEYSRAAKKLKELGSEIKLAKVDATVETKLAEKYGIQGYPTLKFFKKDRVIQYSGGRTETELISWLRKKTSPPSLRLDSLEEIQDFLKMREVAVFFFGEQSDGILTYHLAAEDFETIEFVNTTNMEAAKHYGVAPGSVLLFNKPNGVQAKMEPGFTEATLEAFIAKESQRYLEIFSELTAPRIFGSQNTKYLILFDVSESGDSMKVFREVAPKVHSQIQCVFIETDIEENKQIVDFFRISDHQVPQILLITLDGDMEKYQMFGDITKENIYNFIAGFEAGKLEQHLMSEEIPETQNGPVYKLVGKSFHEVVKNSAKGVFVHFYAPWCGYCQKLEPIWDKLAELMKDNKDVVIAKLDTTVNEVRNVKVPSLPTLRFFHSDGRVVDYKGSPTLDGFQMFINAGFKNTQIADSDN